MKKIIGPHHLHPKEIFPEAKTVVSFFLPFEKELVKLNWKSQGPVKEWIQAKGETDHLIGEISERLIVELAKNGIEAVVLQLFLITKIRVLMLHGPIKAQLTPPGWALSVSTKC